MHYREGRRRNGKGKEGGGRRGRREKGEGVEMELVEGRRSRNGADGRERG